MPDKRVSMSTIVNVFTPGKKGPHKYSQFYKGGAIISNTDSNVGTIPASGRINLKGFVGSYKAINYLNGSLIRRRRNFNLDTTATSLANMNTFFNTLDANELVFATNFSLPAADYYGMEYTGWFSVPTSGSYSFGLRSDDGSDLALWINNKWDVITTAYGLKPPETLPPNPGTRTLTAGVLYPIRVRFYEASGGEALNVEWIQPGGSTWAAIPFSNFRCHATTPISTTTIRFGYPDPRYLV